MNPVASIVVVDLKLTFRDKMTLFWIIVFPLIFLLFAAYLWTPTPTVHTVHLGVVNEDSGASYPVNGTLLINVMRSVKYEGKHLFKIKTLGNVSDAIDLLGNGSIDAAIVIPRGYSENMSYGYPAKLDLYISKGADPGKYQVVRNILISFLSEFGKQVRMKSIEYVERFMPQQGFGNFTKEQIVLWMKGFIEPMKISVEDVPLKNVMTRAKIIGWYVIAMIGVEALYTGMIGGAVTIVGEKERGTLNRLLSSPIGPWTLLAGKTIAVLIDILVSAAIVAIFGVLFLGAELPINPLNPLHILAILLLLLGTLASIGIGLIISLFARRSESASGVASGLAWPLMFVTGIVYPKWLLPDIFKHFSDVFPVSAALEAMRGIIIYGWGWGQVAGYLPTVLLGPVAFYLLGVLSYRFNLKRMVS